MALFIIAFVPLFLIGGILEMKIIKGFSNQNNQALEEAGKVMDDLFLQHWISFTCLDLTSVEILKPEIEYGRDLTVEMAISANVWRGGLVRIIIIIKRYSVCHKTSDALAREECTAPAAADLLETAQKRYTITVIVITQSKSRYLFRFPTKGSALDSWPGGPGLESGSGCLGHCVMLWARNLHTVALCLLSLAIPTRVPGRQKCWTTPTLRHQMILPPNH